MKRPAQPQKLHLHRLLRHQFIRATSRRGSRSLAGDDAPTKPGLLCGSRPSRCPIRTPRTAYNAGRRWEDWGLAWRVRDVPQPSIGIRLWTRTLAAYGWSGGQRTRLAQRLGRPALSDRLQYCGNRPALQASTPQAGLVNFPSAFYRSHSCQRWSRGWAHLYSARERRHRAVRNAESESFHRLIGELRRTLRSTPGRYRGRCH